MKTNEINIRDPYILLYEDTYYLYGTRSHTCWGPADGFDCYISRDLESWEGPFEVFHRPEGFFADRSYWAPECYEHKGRFYLIATLGCETRKKGIYTLAADSPLGPFTPVGDLPLTPPDWTCIDGSLYRDRDDTPWLIFSHSFEDDPRGAMCALKLHPDLTGAEGEPITLFYAGEAPWATPIPFAKAEFGMDGDVYFTDGPCVYRREDGGLVMLWASWSDRGYAVGTAVSPSGEISGPWYHLPDKLFEDGGHGMLFRTHGGKMLYTLHAPNEKGKEHPVFAELAETEEGFCVRRSGLALGIELGSTRIKAVAIDECYAPVSAGDHNWKSSYENGVWTYSLDEVWAGLKAALSALECREQICIMGVSAMMHGYLAFDADWNLLVPFRTWQNTITGPAAAQLTELFGFQIPQRWSIAHLYQAVLNGEEHVSRIAHITTLAGYVHYMLTGVNAVGVGEASGIFPVDSEACNYDEAMLTKFEALTKDQPWNIRELLPAVLAAGEKAGCLTENGSALLGGLLSPGIPFAPAEGDAGTGMTATNAVAPRTGNVSAGTSIFSMVVLEHPLSRVHEEIDLVTTPTGKPVAMVHCNNCTNDMNAWVSLLGETARLFGAQPDTGELYTKLYEKSLEGAADCGGIMVCNYLSGEGVTHLDQGRPLVARRPDSDFTLANFLRSQLYSTMATLKIGMDILAEEQVAIDSLTGHGGLFKTPVVGQKYMAAACNAPVACMETAGEGGPYGMALLCAYAADKAEGETLEQFLANRVFAGAKSTTMAPDPTDAAGFDHYIRCYKALLDVERRAVELL